uniref:Terminase n=1 Tax=Desulfobacca acetoxidans TaxID=60893 RepID=A0A7C5AK97_9BACT
MHINIIQTIHDENLLGKYFKDLSTWGAWLVFLRDLFGLSVPRREWLFYRKCTGGSFPQGKKYREAWVIAGRRSGKSFIASVVAVYLACFRDYRHWLSAGERAHILLVAADRNQAQVLMNYIRGFLKDNRMLAKMIEAERAESIDLTNRVTIQIATSSYRALRGYTLAAAICDEVAFWRSDDGANPATEVLRSLRPALASIPHSMLLCISSPYMRSGPVWDIYRKHYGRVSDVLVWQAPTLTMNPTLDPDLIARDLEADPEAARSEWEAEFRSDLETFLPLEALQSVVIPGRHELPPQAGVHYTAFVDPSGGRGDAAALAIAHIEGEKVVLDLARRWPAPHNPQAVIEEMARVLKVYGIRRVVGDRYAGEWPRQEFARHQIGYDPAPQDKNRIYLDFLPLVLSGRVELLDLKRLANELRDLVRRPRSTGRDLVDHPPRGQDDLANATAGAVTLAGVGMIKPQARVRWISTESPWRRLSDLHELFYGGYR